MANYNILIVDDDAELRGAVRSYLELKGFTAAEAKDGRSCRSFLDQHHPDLILMDYSLPDADGLRLLQDTRNIDATIPVIIMTGHATIELAVRCMKEGAEQFITKPFELGVLLRLIEKVLDAKRFIRKELAVTSMSPRYRRDPFIGNSSAILGLKNAVQRVLGSDYPILIQGETGTGKGVLAEWITRNGSRSNEAFLDLNCAGLNRELLESDLFGHEKGAFTGAFTQKTGLFEVAHRGTLFLDEIGDMDLGIQPKLLKVLDEKRFRRLGGVRDRAVDVHLIAATHQNMAALVADGKFRSDLYFRVSTIPLSIPSLRQRIEDIPILADWFLEHLRADLNSGKLAFGPAVMRDLSSYSWPGNIRELRNVLERAALICHNGLISTEDLHFQLTRGEPAATVAPPAYDGELTLAELERQHVVEVLRRENGKVDNAAAKLGIPRSSLYAKIKQLGLSVR